MLDRVCVFSLVMTFYVETSAESSHKVLPGTEVVQELRKKLRTNADLFEYKVVKIHTLGKHTLYFQIVVINDCCLIYVRHRCVYLVSEMTNSVGQLVVLVKNT